MMHTNKKGITMLVFFIGLSIPSLFLNKIHYSQVKAYNKFIQFSKNGW